MDEDTSHPAAVPVRSGPGSQAPTAGLRAGDADRERAVALLREATIAGKLTLDEFSTRIERALQARTHAELLELGADLGGAMVPAAPALPRARRWVVTSRLERRGRWQLPDGYQLNVVCGTVVLDLGQAVVEEAVTTLHVRNLFGTVTILVPDAVQVEIDDGGVFLTNEIKLPERPAPDHAPLIRIRATGMGGTNCIHAAPGQS